MYWALVLEINIFSIGPSTGKPGLMYWALVLEINIFLLGVMCGNCGNCGIWQSPQGAAGGREGAAFGPGLSGDLARLLSETWFPRLGFRNLVSETWFPRQGFRDLVSES